MNLSIIIVNYRSWSILSRCLDALLIDPDSGDWQIIVADNFSDDGEVSRFRNDYPQVQFLENRVNGGFAYGCNAGADAAHGDYLLFLNPDVIAGVGQVGRLLGEAQGHPGVAIMAAQQINAKGQLQKTWDVFPDLLTYFKSVKSLLRRILPAKFPNPRTAQDGLVYCDWVTGSVFLISRQHFDALGRWCEDYWMYSEDCDLCFLAHQQGLRVACTSHAQFVHLHGGASRQNRGITVLTKTEAIISKHVFNSRHRRGLHGITNHLLIVLTSVPELIFWTLIDLLTLRRVPALSVRSSMLKRISAYYAGALGKRSWRSPQLEG